MALPFSESYEVVNQNKKFAIIPLFIAMAALAGIHYIATTISYGRYIYMLLLIIVNLYAWKKSFNIAIEV